MLALLQYINFINQGGSSTVEIPAASQKQLTNPVVFPYALKVFFPKWLIHNFLLANSIYQIGYQDSR